MPASSSPWCSTFCGVGRPVLSAELDLEVPEALIAQGPMEPRDACRLLTLDRSTGALDHHVFRDLPALLRPGDIVVVNDSKVLPARLHTRKITGGAVELLFLRPVAPSGEGERHEATDVTAQTADRWEALARPSRRLRVGMTLLAPGGERLLLDARLEEGRWLVSTPEHAQTPASLLMRHGELPLPPYIRTPPADLSAYQTVFADPLGSAAAPTAGLHLTDGLLARLAERGVQVQTVTLHVGLDTFRPLSTERVEDHAIHREAYRVSAESLRALDEGRASGRRLIAVGTTVVRVLETLYRGVDPGGPAAGPPDGWADLFITPGYRFRAVDGLITNFHLPRTTLLALVMAFAGVEHVRSAYASAIAQGYRFYSFGDAMLIADGSDGDQRPTLQATGI